MRARLFTTCSNKEIKQLRSNVREGGPIARRAKSHEGRMRIRHYQVCAIDSLNGISQTAHAYGKQKRHESRSKQYPSHLHRQLKQSSQQWLWRPNLTSQSHLQEQVRRKCLRSPLTTSALRKNLSPRSKACEQPVIKQILRYSRPKSLIQVEGRGAPQIGEVVAIFAAHLILPPAWEV